MRSRHDIENGTPCQNVVKQFVIFVIPGDEKSEPIGARIGLKPTDYVAGVSFPHIHRQKPSIVARFSGMQFYVNAFRRKSRVRKIASVRETGAMLRLKQIPTTQRGMALHEGSRRQAATGTFVRSGSAPPVANSGPRSALRHSTSSRSLSTSCTSRRLSTRTRFLEPANFPMRCPLWIEVARSPSRLRAPASVQCDRWPNGGNGRDSRRTQARQGKMPPCWF